MSKKRGGSYFDDDEDFVETESIDDSSSELSENNIDQDDDEENQEEIEDEQEEEFTESEDEDEDEDENEQKGGGEDGEDEEDDGDKEKNTNNKKLKKMPQRIISMDDDDDEDDDGESYLKKFDENINNNYIVNFHPECALQNYDEIMAMTKVVRDKDGIIVDELHRTIPYLTKYEKARILGQRAKQINSGATPFVKVPENVIDGYLIAQLELEQKRIPFIIRRPLPNGGSEYWSLKDLENISF
jgi:DNA-directed RNA polymerases I, II, and III subunit RPABC2